MYTQKKMKVVGVDADTELALAKLSEGNRVAFADAEDPGFWSTVRRRTRTCDRTRESTAPV